MKKLHVAPTPLSLGLFLLTLSSAVSLHADSYAWNGGAGNWDTTTVNWNTDTTWVNAADAEAVFTNTTAGTVTLTEAITANKLSFALTGYTIAGSSDLTLAGTTPTIDVASDVTATISAKFAGTSGFAKTGAGTLTLTATSNPLTGSVAVDGGLLRLAASTTQSRMFSNVDTTITVNNGGTLDFAINDIWTSSGDGIAPKIIINAGGTVTNSGGTFFNNLGDVVLNGGTLNAAVANANYGSYALGTSVEVIGATTSYITGNNIRIGSSTQTSTTFTVAENAILHAPTLANARINAGTLQTAKLIKEGSGTMRIFGNASYTGGTDINAGVFEVTGNVTSLGGGVVSIASTGTLLASQNNAWTFSNTVTGSGIIIKDGTGNLLLTGDHGGFTGQYILRNGLFRFNANSIGANSSILFDSVAPSSSLAQNNNVDVTWASTTTLEIAAGKYAGFSPYGGRTFTINAGISGQGHLHKQDTGNFILAGENTYTGKTLVAQGVLTLGATGSIYTSSEINISSGATLNVSAHTDGYAITVGQILSGNGTVTGDLAVAGTISTGDSVGTLNFNGDVTLTAGAKIILEINDDVTAWDVLNFNGGTLDIESGTTLLVVFNGDPTSLEGVTLNVNQLITGAGQINGLTNLIADPAGWQFTWDDLDNPTALTFTQVPEPGTYALFGAIGAVGLALLRRRR